MKRLDRNILRGIVVGCICLLAGRGHSQTRPATEPNDVPNAALRWEQALADQRDAGGFMEFTLLEKARQIKVSSSEGWDTGDGQRTPVKTLRRAIALVRNGYPDQILFKRGDIFGHESLNAPLQRGGRSALEPMVVGAYGDPALPRPVLEARLGLGGREGHPNFLVLQDLDFYADSRDPDSPSFDPRHSKEAQDKGIYMNTGSRFLWIEGCRLRFFGNNIELQSPKSEPCRGLVIRRCVIADSWDAGGHSQGIYLENFWDVLIEENVFDHNGWNDRIDKAGKTIFNHNMYLQKPVTLGDERHFIVRNNISARASSHGCQLRPGGLLENNLFLKNPRAAFVYSAPSIVRNNVVLDGDGIGSQPRGQGLEFLDCTAILAEGNIIAHKSDAVNVESALAYDPRNERTDLQPSQAEIRHNIVYDWSGPVFNTNSVNENFSVHDNDFEQLDNPLVELNKMREGIVFQNNHYSSRRPQPFRIEQNRMSLEDWCAQTGEKPNAVAPELVDPSRDIVSYAKSIGLADATLEGFLAAARKQQRGHWDHQLTAEAVNDYIRAGFALKTR